MDGVIIKIFLLEKLKKVEKKELVRFLVAGGIVLVVDYLTYIFFMYVSLNMPVAKGLSYICGATVGFIINKLWTFEIKCNSTLPREVSYFIALYAITAIFNILTNSAVYFLFGNQMFAYLCATGVSTVMNFLGLKFIVFRRFD